MSEVRARWAKLPPAQRDRRMAQSAAARARATRWAELPEGER
ncbi:hypothetical protein ACIBSS_27970 [Micromonospora aurantiaca]